MNLLNRLTLKSMKLNRKRTIVTIIGVILATAMITTVSILVTSARASLVNYALEESGRWHYKFDDVDSSELAHIQENRQVENWYVTKQMGYAMLEGSRNEYKPYLRLFALDMGAMENLSLTLAEGRMPQNDRELVIARHIRTNGRVDYQVGDTVSLAVGERTDGSGNTGFVGEYQPGEETLSVTEHRTYTIVGVIERPNMELEPFSEAGYTVITYLDDAALKGKVNVYAYYTKEGLKNEEEVTGGLEEAWKDCGVTGNRTLLRYQALNFSGSTMNLILTVAAIVLAIIMFTAVFCIRNSFAISITEKMQQYGMLASVGATSKQIRKNVFFEAFLLGLIGIPLGIGSGILASWILLWVCNRFFEKGFFLTLVFSVSPAPILVAALLAYITILISARRSAKRASKVSPLEAIRATGDVKINPKKVRSPKWVKRCFGIGGELADKNLKRSRKKYRTTVVSIVVSVALFIAMWSFVGMAFGTIGLYYTNYTYNLALGAMDEDGEAAIGQALAENELVKGFSLIHYSDGALITKETLRLSEEHEDYMGTQAEDYYIQVISLGGEAYADYLKELGLKEAEVAGKAILNDVSVVEERKNGKRIYHEIRDFAYQPGDTITLKKGWEEDCPLQTVELVAVTDKKPMGMDNYSNLLIISDADMKQMFDGNIGGSFYVNAKDADALELELRKEFDTRLTFVHNQESTARQERSFYMIFAIFFYGFIAVISLIGVTNIFNTITTNMELRSREFAMLRSIGMTKKEFTRMIRLESLFYGAKSLLIGVPIGIVLSVLLYRAFAESADFGYSLPVGGIAIAVAAVFLLIACIMRYSMNRINRQNIIETIRNENI